MAKEKKEAMEGRGREKRVRKQMGRDEEKKEDEEKPEDGGERGKM